MNPDELVDSFTAFGIPKTHATVGLSNIVASNQQYRTLFINRRLPDEGWSDVQIQHLLYTLSTLDTNNKGNDGRWCGVGEREGRCYSNLVRQRHFGLAHGMGRSGDIAEAQPKAVGSTVLVRLTLILALDAIRRGSGLNAKTAAKHGILLPMCTGMSMALVLTSLRSSNSAKSIVLWSRIDQKSCFKAVATAGMECVVVPTQRDGDQVVTDVDALTRALEQYSDRVLAVITTTSCFAPRVPDRVDEVARLCQERDVVHIINNAYGLQSASTSKLINRACTVGRVDAIVCSTDKNFLVPVGGAIVLSPDEKVVQTIGKVYAGRASSSPIVDLFITLLSMGLNGYKQLLEERVHALETFTSRFEEVAAKHGERALLCPLNDISYGITLDALVRPQSDDENDAVYFNAVSKDVSSFGAMLFSRCVSGTRVIPRGEVKLMGGQTFVGFGSSVDDYPHAYMTAACAIGVSVAEMDDFFVRLDKVFREYHKRRRKHGES